MSSDNIPTDQWTSCPAGTLQQIAAQQATAARLSARRRSTLGAAASVLVAAGVVVTAGLASGQAPVEIKCKGCKQRFAEFYEHVNGRQEMADPRIVEGMKRHLKKCERCRKKFRDAFPGCPLGDNHRCRDRDDGHELSAQRGCEPGERCSPCGSREPCGA